MAISSSLSTRSSHTVLAGSQDITLADADTYYCNGTYGNDQVFEESIDIIVRGKHVLHPGFLYILFISNWQWVAERDWRNIYYIACIHIFFLSVGFTGIASTAYLRTSFKSINRLNASGLVTTSNEEIVNSLEELVCIYTTNNILTKFYILLCMTHCRYLD